METDGIESERAAEAAEQVRVAEVGVQQVGRDLGHVLADGAARGPPEQAVHRHLDRLDPQLAELARGRARSRAGGRR